MPVIGIETSCDETAAAVVYDERTVLSNVVISQIDVHKEFGGVVPEIASRKHVQAISMVIEKAVRDSGVSYNDIDGVAVTRGPGLVGALMVGISAAKGLAVALETPICGVNHLHGHLYAIFLENKDVSFPYLGLVVSGGHTSFYYVKGHFEIELIGKTRDDAAGEAFDKVAKLLGLGYPGGGIIEELALKSVDNSMRFPRAMMEKDSLDFSFSGLKTAVLHKVKELFGPGPINTRPGSYHSVFQFGPMDAVPEVVNSIARAFQESVVDVLSEKSFRAAIKLNVDKIVVCGGVACNGALRRRMQDQGKTLGIEAIFPSPVLCSDNAAMIASRGYTLFSHDMTDNLEFGALSRWPGQI
jgi:N6-L-threonylcarbamoyladenine synthase